MAVSKSLYGTIGEEKIYAYTLTNAYGFSAEILTYAGIIRRLIFAGVDVVLGKETLEDYLDNPENCGVIIGRNANRIEKGEFALGGQTHILAKNDGENNLHSGYDGFNKKIWKARAKDGKEPKITLSYTSPDGEGGFPGKAKVSVTYTLTLSNELKITYEAKSDKDTLFNMTSHSYFNLNGHGVKNIKEHMLKVEADFFTPTREDCIPTGEIFRTADTAFDFKEPRKIGEALSAEDEQVKMQSGFDHNFVLNGSGYRKAASLEGDESGILMEVYTDCRGLQFYSGQNIPEGNISKGGAKYEKFGGLCLETQAIPNAVNVEHFPSPVCPAGKRYKSETSYKFSKK